MHCHLLLELRGMGLWQGKTPYPLPLHCVEKLSQKEWHCGINCSFLRDQMVEIIPDHRMSWEMSLGCDHNGSEVRAQRGGHSCVPVMASSQAASF